ncbi:helix-turn-helix domain-containing protein [Novosphingopyxis sp.]|uniref:helix-turn-helix domain-containing protein n=1 Tax=Novosphingopyxis sp. TaxID=2709690 RepID=UPI003B5B55C9
MRSEKFDHPASLLTETQVDYLRLVSAGLTSKEIAQKVGGSHHTVNSEIGIAMRVLGAKSRRDAAGFLNLLSNYVSYESSYEPSAIPKATILSEPEGGGEKTGLISELRLPMPTKSHPINDMSVWKKTGWILVLASAVALLVGGLVSGIVSMLSMNGILS